MKFLMLFAVLASGGVSGASFEMLLASDSVGDVVHRVDPLSGVYLGSFGGGVLADPQAVAVDQANNIAYVLDRAGGRVSKWNYNTGAFAGSFTTTGMNHLAFNLDGSLSLTSNTLSRRVTNTGVIIQNYTISSGFNGLHGFLGADGSYYVASRTGSNRSFQRYNAATGALLSSQGWGIDRAARISGTRYLNGFDVNGSLVFCEVDDINGGANNLGATSTNLISTVNGVAVGHDGMAYLSGTTATGTGILRFDSNTFAVGSIFGTNLGNITGISSVVAPEPGTVTALAIGAMALLRRRRPV